jgi:hypothetical protein
MDGFMGIIMHCRYACWHGKTNQKLQASSGSRRRRSSAKKKQKKGRCVRIRCPPGKKWQDAISKKGGATAILAATSTSEVEGNESEDGEDEYFDNFPAEDGDEEIYSEEEEEEEEEGDLEGDNDVDEQYLQVYDNDAEYLQTQHDDENEDEDDVDDEDVDEREYEEGEDGAEREYEEDEKADGKAGFLV